MPVSEHIIIDGKPYKQYTARGMFFGQVAEVPATPFAQKRGQGDPTLADSLTLSYFGMDSFHGGRGQDKARSPFAFMDSKRMITFIRDRAIPAPKVFTLGGGTGVEYIPGDVSSYHLGSPDSEYEAYGESFVCPAGGLTVSDIQFYMRLSNVGVGFNVEFALYDESASKPNAKLKSVTMTPSDFTTSFGWVSGSITPEVLTPSATYWLVVERLGTGEPHYVVGHDAAGGYSGVDGFKIGAALQDYYNGVAYTVSLVYGVWWSAQTFTTNKAYTITSLKLKMFRDGNPGTVTVSIRATDGAGEPTGGDLASGTTNGNTLPTGPPGEWREIDIADYALSADTKYAIVVRATTGNANNNVQWRLATGNPYSGGNKSGSSDSGSSWDPYLDGDGLFETYGYPGTLGWDTGAGKDLYFKINGGQVLPAIPRHAIEFYGSKLVHDTEKKNSVLSYTTENSDECFTDDLQDFTEWQTTSGDAEFIIRVHNSDGTLSWGFLGAKVSATEIRVFTNRNRTTPGWNGDATGTPETYSVKNTVMIPNTLFVAMGKGVYYSDETPEGGLATGGSATTLKDAKASFGVDTYNTGYTLYLVGGKGVGQAADITDTAENQLTVNATLSPAPDKTTRYIVRKEIPLLQTSKTNFKYNVSSMVVFKDKLYAAQGWRGGRPMWSLSGYTPTQDWVNVKVRAEHLFVHVNADGDEALWRSRGHRIDCSTDGENFGDVIEVGGRKKWVTGMDVYGGEFFAFKEDGWYVIDLETWTAERICDFTKSPDVDAFKARCEHAGEYYGGKGGGVWRYTPGPDMTPVGPDRGAVEPDLYSGHFRPFRQPGRSAEDPIRHGSGWGLPEIRLGKVRALVSTTNFLFAAMDARREDRFSSILGYNRMGWHEIVRATAIKDRMLLLHYSPEISPEARLWFGEGKSLKYIKLPDLGDNPYLWGLSEYVDEAELETSRYDAERPTHRKTLMECGVQSQDLLAGSREIEVYYEADRSDLWVLWGTITLSPYEKLYMARSDIGADKTVASNSTTTVIKVDSTTGMVAGEWVRIGTEHRQILTIDSSTQFTVTLPFPSAPASGVTVYGGWPVVHEVALRFRGTTDDTTKGWALCGFAGGWLPRPPREWSRTVILEIADGVVKGRSAADTWEDLQALADRPEPITYKDYWGNEHDVFVLEPQFKPLAEEEDAVDKHISRGYAVVRMLDATLS